MSAKKISNMGTGILINSIIGYSLGVGVNPPIVLYCGYLLSVLITTIITIIIGALCVKAYDFYKIDWLLIEALKKARLEKSDLPNNKVVEFIIKWSDKNKFLLFIFLFFRDSVLTVIYYREGDHLYNGFPTWKIKKLFLLSALSINIWWNAFLYLGFSLWNYLMTLF